MYPIIIEPVKFSEMLIIPKRIQPTGPRGSHGSGCGQGRGRGKVPNQLLTSPETMQYVLQAEEHTSKKDEAKKEKEQFVKQALANKAKRERVERRRKLNFNK